MWRVIVTDPPEQQLTPSTAQESSGVPMILPTIPLPQTAPLVQEVSPVSQQKTIVVRDISYQPKALTKEIIEGGVRLNIEEKQGLTYKYSCEFDAVWMILQSYGISVSVDELITQFPHDNTVEPYLVEDLKGIRIIGGDITRMYSGDIRKNYLARTTGKALSPLFLNYGLEVKPVHSRADLISSLDSGSPVWIKATVDFADGRPTLWVTPSGDTIATVVGNDHAVVVVGYTDKTVIVKDPLGPTSSNIHRPYEYEIPWNHFLKIWASQQNDGLAVILQEKTE